MVWDLPTRLFHWGFVISIVGSYISGERGRWKRMNYSDWPLGSVGLSPDLGLGRHETARLKISARAENHSYLSQSFLAAPQLAARP